MLTGEKIMIIIAAFVAILLQIFLAPHIAIGSAIPNFSVALCLAVALTRFDQGGPIMPFIMGLVFDLSSGGPVGAMALALTITTMFASWFYERAKNDTVFMAIAALAICVLITEVIYGLVFLMFGYASGFIEAIVYRIVPCFVYDFILAIIAYLIASRFLGNDPVSRTEIKQL